MIKEEKEVDTKVKKAIKKVRMFQNIFGIISLIALTACFLSPVLWVWISFNYFIKIFFTTIVVFLVSKFLNVSFKVAGEKIENNKKN